MKNSIRNIVGLFLSFLILSACTNNKAPVAKFEVNQTSGTTATMFRFDASSSQDPDGDIANYRWNFGESGEASEQMVNYQFENHGVYEVTLTVADSAGAKSSSSQDISVAPTPQELEQIAILTAQRNVDLYEEARADEASQALEYLILSPSAPPPVNPQLLASLFKSGTEPGKIGKSLMQLDETFALPRGTYELDETSGAWVLLENSSELVLRYQTPEPVEIVVDWDVTSSTQKVLDGYNNLVEVPTDMLARMTVAGKEAAKIAAKVSWHNAPECGGAILEPSSFSVSGFFGLTTKISFDTTASLNENATSSDSGVSKGFFEITSGEDFERIEWDISATGKVKRATENDLYYPACFILDATVDNVDLSVKAQYKQGNYQERFAVTLNVKPIYQDDFIIAAEIQGQLQINGAPAVDAKGRLDDSNGNGIPGENVTVTYADGSKESLEQYLGRATLKAAVRSFFTNR